MVHVVVAVAVGHDDVRLELLDLARHHLARLDRVRAARIAEAVDVVAVEPPDLGGVQRLLAANCSRFGATELVVPDVAVAGGHELDAAALGDQLGGRAAANDVGVIGMAADHHDALRSRRARDRRLDRRTRRDVGAPPELVEFASRLGLAVDADGGGHKPRKSQETSSVQVHLSCSFSVKPCGEYIRLGAVLQPDCRALRALPVARPAT